MLDAIISAAGNIAGGILGSQSANKDRKLQKEFAQNSIRWKVDDAKAAGLHPLAALGAQTTSYAPVSVGGPSIASGLSAAGQDISRAVNATRTGGERATAYTKTVQDLTLSRMGLENELLASQIAKINQAGVPPPMPSQSDRYLIDGQAQSGLVKTSPLARQSSAPGVPSQEAGAVPEVGFTRGPTGWAPAMSKDAKDRLEEDELGILGWNLRNRFAPMFGSRDSWHPPAIKLKENEYWYFNPLTQVYEKKLKSKSRWWNGGFGYKRVEY